jgi:pilus assembly protein TadC
LIELISFLSGFCLFLGVTWYLLSDKEDRISRITGKAHDNERQSLLEVLTDGFKKTFGFLFPKNVQRGNVQKRLLWSGLNLDPDEYYTIRIISVVSPTFLTLPLSMLLDVGGFFMGFMLAVAGFFLPELMVSNKINSRTKAIEREILPFAELLTVMASGGLTQYRALEKVVHHTAGVLPELFDQAFQKVESNEKNRVNALLEIKEKTQVNDCKLLVDAIVQSIRHSTPFQVVMDNNVSQLRENITNRGISIAAKTENSMTVPIMIGVMFPLFALMLGMPIIGFFL